ncbi:MAG: 30S ribosomal protein S8 [Nanoarchaeota archaeon]|nr:30S ribosomal protein S8 [Nanoarchaeota archaeon]
MSQDITADALNQIMNAKKAGKESLNLARHSKLLESVLKIAKEHNYIEEFKIEDEILTIKIGKLNKCQAIKPRYYVKKEGIDKYIRRYLPARDFGIIIVSTNKGLMTNIELHEEKIGGSVIAYFY